MIAFPIKPRMHTAATTGAAMLDYVNLTRLDDILAAHTGLEGPLLPILHSVQRTFGYIPQETLPVIAEHLNISRAEIHGVVSFYHDFREAPAGRHTIKLCRAEACQAMGADHLAAHAKAALGVDWHQTTPDGAITFEPVFCLGLCACAPAALIDGQVRGRVDAARLDTFIAACRT